MRTFIKVALSLGLALSIASCGFHLRGAVSLPENADALYVDNLKHNTRLLNELKRSLKLNGANLVALRSEANTRLTVIDETSETRTASLNNIAQVAEIALYVSARFQINDAKGELQAGPYKVSSSRVYAHNVDETVASGREAELLREELEEELVRQIVRYYRSYLDSQNVKAEVRIPDGSPDGTPHETPDE